MEVVRYKEWMLDQVIALFVEEYGFEEVNFRLEFDLILNHKFQNGKSVGLAAIDGVDVLGFTSFIFWPIQSQGGEVLKTYQSGNTVVGKKFRGRGVFSGLLKAIQKGVEGFHYDFLIGFPVEQSYPGFVKYGWESPFKLKWMVKLADPLRALGSVRKVRTRLGCGHPSGTVDCSGYLGVEGALSVDFQDYRSAIRKGNYLIGTVNKGGDEIYYEIKYLIRKRFWVEGVLGRIAKRSGLTVDKSDIENILEVSDCHMRVSSYSFAYVEGSNVDGFWNAGFSEMKSKQIHFIYMNGDRSFSEASGVPNLGRADIDTW